MWLNPVPAETVMGAIIGAVLSSIMASLNYFNLATWLDVLFPLSFTFLILLFGVSSHFYCAATLQKKGPIRNVFGLVCLLTLASVICLDPQRAKISAAEGLQFLPSAGNFLMGGVLVIWFLSIRALTEFNKRTQAPE